MSRNIQMGALLFVISTGVGFTSHVAQADDQTPAATSQSPDVIHYKYAPDVNPAEYNVTPEQVAACKAKEHHVNLKDVGLGSAELVYEDTKTAWNDGLKPAGEAVGTAASDVYHNLTDDIVAQIKKEKELHNGWDLRVIVVGFGKGAYLVGQKDGHYMVKGFGQVGKAFVKVGKGLKTAGKYVAEPYKDHNYGDEDLVSIGKTVGVGTYYLGDKVGHKVWHGLEAVGRFFTGTTNTLADHYHEPVVEQSESRTLRECLANAEEPSLDPDQTQIPDAAVNGALGVSSNTPVQSDTPAIVQPASVAPASAAPAIPADLPRI